MAEEKVESPTMTEGETEKKVVEDSVTDVDGLIAELEKADIKTTEDLTNKLAVTQEYGHVVNLLGDIRKENEDLKEMLRTNPKRSTGNEDINDFSEVNSEIDLGNVIENKIGKALKKDREEQSKLQRESQAQALQRYQKVIGHKHFSRVKDVYEAKLGDPSTMIQLNTGQVSYEDLFHDTLNEYWEGIARKSVETIKALKGTGTETPLHVETDTEIPGKTVTDTGGSKRLKQATKEVNEGKTLTEDEEIEALMDSLTK